MKFTLSKARRFGWLGLEGWALNSNQDFSRESVAYFEVAGRHGKIKNKKSDRAYLVLDGTGEFSIRGKKVPVKRLDVVIVPKNTPYDFRATRGTLKLFLVDAPAYDPTSDVILE